MAQTFYFTYGSEGQPFAGGWTKVIADSRTKAVKAFCIIHPDNDGLVDCADIYSEQEFVKTEMFKNGNFGAKCHEVILLSRVLYEAEEGVN